MEIKDKLRHNFPWDISIFPVRLHAPQGCGRSDERMAELENCMRCGGLYVMDRFHYCNDCMKWFTETCGAVKDYLRKHPNRTLWDVHVDLGMPLSVVQQVVRFSEE